MEFDPAVLRAFVAVTETGGFTRAAGRLNLTQSAISHQIRRLERQVGRPLFHRTTRSLSLTEDGEEFLRHATRILELNDVLTRRFRPSPVSGIVRFGVPESFMGERLPPMLAQFSRAFPDVRLDVTVCTYPGLRAMIREGALDLAVVLVVGTGETPDLGEGGTVLRRTRFVWVAAESFATGQGKSVPFAFAPAPCVNREAGIAALEGSAIPWHIAFTSASEQGLRAAVRAGLAVAVQTQGELEPGTKIVDGRYGLPPLPRADFALIWSAGEKSRAARMFGQMILDPHAAPAPRPKAASRA